MTLIHLDGFESGVISTPLYSIGGHAVIDSSNARTGNYCLKVYTMAGVGSFLEYWFTDDQISGRLYFKTPSSFPVSEAKFFFIHATSSAADMYGVLNSSGQVKLYVENGSGSSSTSSALSTDTYYRFDFKASVVATVHVMYGKIDGGTELSASASGSSGLTFSEIGLGSDIESPMTLYFDDFILDDTYGNYPLGSGRVKALLPIAEGTHNAGSIIQDTAGNVIDGTTYKAYPLLDDIPITSGSDFVRQSSNGASNYAEVTFSGVPYTRIQGIMAFEGHHGFESLNSCNGTVRIIDGSNTTDIFSGTIVSELIVPTKLTVLPYPIASGWTTAKVNALKGRVGFSTDANPDPCFDVFILQVAYEEGFTDTLVVADNSSTTQVDNVTLTQNKTLVVSDSHSTSQADNVELQLQADTLTVDDSGCDSTSENITLTTPPRVRVTWIQFEVPLVTTPVLVVQDSFSTSQTDSVALTQKQTIIVNDSFSISQTDSIVLQENRLLVVEDSFVTTQVDEISLTTLLIVADSSSVSFVENIVLTQNYTLVVSDLFSTSQLDTISLSQKYTLLVADSFSTSQVDNVVLLLEGYLSTADSFVETFSDTITLTQKHNLVVQDSYTETFVDTLYIVEDITLTVLDSFSTTQVDSFAIEQTLSLSVSDSFVETYLEDISVTQKHNLVVQDSSSVTFADTVFVTTLVTISVEDSYSTCFVETVELRTGLLLELQDLFTNTYLDTPLLVQDHFLNITDSYVQPVLEMIYFITGCEYHPDRITKVSARKGYEKVDSRSVQRVQPSNRISKAGE